MNVSLKESRQVNLIWICCDPDPINCYLSHVPLNTDQPWRLIYYTGKHKLVLDRKLRLNPMLKVWKISAFSIIHCKSLSPWKSECHASILTPIFTLDVTCVCVCVCVYMCVYVHVCMCVCVWLKIFQGRRDPEQLVIDIVYNFSGSVQMPSAFMELGEKMVTEFWDPIEGALEQSCQVLERFLKTYRWMISFRISLLLSYNIFFSFFLSSAIVPMTFN